MKQEANVMTKALKWAAVGCVLAGTTLGPGTVAARGIDPNPSENDRPNVVLILSDNVGYGDIGGAFQGGEIRGMPTPRINQLQSEGLTFTQFITEPGCTPSRAGLLTGRFALSRGLVSIIVPGSANTV